MEIPTTIRCKVIKKSEWSRYDNRMFKSISLDIESGRYFSHGDENTKDFEYSTINLSICRDIPCFFDSFEVGQIVEMEIKALATNEKS